MKKLTLNAPSKEKALAFAQTKYSPEEYDFEVETLEPARRGIMGFGEKKGKYRICITKKQDETEDETLDDILADLNTPMDFALDLAPEKKSEPIAEEPAPAPAPKKEETPAPKAQPVPEKKPQPQKPKDARPKETPKAEPKTEEPEWKKNPEESAAEAEKFAEPALDFSDMFAALDADVAAMSTDIAAPELPKLSISVPAPVKIVEPKKVETPAPAEVKVEEPAPVEEKVEEPAPVEEKAEEPAPVEEKAEEPAPVVEEKPEEPAPVVEEKPEEPAPAVEKKPAPKFEDIAPEDLPIALRPPVKRPDAPKKKDKEKKKLNRPADNRTADEKHADLLSAVRGIKAPEKSATANENSVTPAAPRPVKKEDPAEPAPVEAKPFAAAPAPAQRPQRFEKADKPARPKFEKKKPTPREEINEADLVSTGRVDFASPAEMEAALAFLNTLLTDMHLACRAALAPAPQDTEVPEGMVYAKIDVTGDDTSVLIGHHGDTLDSIQYLVNLAGGRAANSHKDYVKIVVDVENYRAKREKTLRDLAKRMAKKALELKKNVVLEPMNPYERRIIHSEIANIANVSTHSVGTDENRKVVVTYEGSDKVEKPPRAKRERPRRRGKDTDVADAETVQRIMSEMEAKKANAGGARYERAESLDDLKHDIGIDLPPLPDEEEADAEEDEIVFTEEELLAEEEGKEEAPAQEAEAPAEVPAPVEAPAEEAKAEEPAEAPAKVVPENTNMDDGVEPELNISLGDEEEHLNEY